MGFRLIIQNDPRHLSSIRERHYRMDIKQTNVSVLLLLIAALLEAGGDAIVRLGLHSTATTIRMMLFVLAGLVLFAYGYVVNAPAWDFGRLLGVYVVFFFVVAQCISWLVFHQRPSTAVLIGGSLILMGGVIISYNP
jgi:small multidrug resistance family-3 protein